jgi:hypothetical protein
MLHRAESSRWTPDLEVKWLLDLLRSRLHATERTDPRIVH